MLQIIEILLYLQLISGSGAVPTAAQINGLAADHSDAIHQIQVNTDLMTKVNHDYYDQAQGIVHIDYDEGIR